jgi:hypothetical protein
LFLSPSFSPPLFLTVENEHGAEGARLEDADVLYFFMNEKRRNGKRLRLRLKTKTKTKSSEAI